MSASRSLHFRDWLFLACAALLFGVTAMTTTEAAPAQVDNEQVRTVTVRPTARQLADLERAFWTCDHKATTEGMDEVPLELCGAVYDELKRAKFGGDYDQLERWWREHKAVEHAKLSRAASR